MNDKKILIISNAALSQTDSNGRNLARLIDFISIERKAQFFVYGNPDFKECKDYYNISDRMALQSFFGHLRIDGHIKYAPNESDNGMKTFKRRKKTPFRMLIREFVWKHGSWNNAYFKEWIDNVNPNCLLVVCGDNAFTLNIAKKISIEKNIPIILYSTEEYPFKNYNYLTKRPSLFYRTWKRFIDKAYKEIESSVAVGVFNTIALCDAFKNNYSYKCCYIYQKTNIDWVDNSKISQPMIVSYLGNLGLNRHKSLIEIANTISDIVPGLKLNVYGRIPKNIKSELQSCQNMNLCGFVNYNDVVKIIHQSTLLIHAEYNSPFLNRDLKYAFSTKISDSISSGTPLLIYANENLAETSFLKDQGCAYVATTKEELSLNIKRALFDVDSRKKILKEAFRVRKEFFEKNDMFKAIIEEVICEKSIVCL